MCLCLCQDQKLGHRSGPAQRLRVTCPDAGGTAPLHAGARHTAAPAAQARRGEDCATSETGRAVSGVLLLHGYARVSIFQEREAKEHLAWIAKSITG